MAKGIFRTLWPLIAASLTLLATMGCEEEDVICDDAYAKLIECGVTVDDDYLKQCEHDINQDDEELSLWLQCHHDCIVEADCEALLCDQTGECGDGNLSEYLACEEGCKT